MDTNKDAPDAHVSHLEKSLMATTYGELFERQVAEKQETILGEPEAIPSLRKIVQRAASPMQARFFAAELLFLHMPDFPSVATEASALPSIYAWALANQQTGNMWGLPGDDDGQAGMHVVRVGQPMIGALVPLFGDDRLLPYGGSIEATTAGLFGYRVKDVAGSLVARISKSGEPFPKQADKAARDAFIKDLESKVGK